MTLTEPLHVLIAGGGLSGLALAQGLIKDGHTCEVFERDADDSRKIGYYLHMNADGGEALRRCLTDDLFELYAETSRRTYDRRDSVVLDDQFNELSSQPHLGPPNEGMRPHTGVHRRTLRSILRARLGGSFRSGHTVAGYKETPSGVSVTLADGTTAQGDVLVGADGIRSAVRRQRLPGTTVIDAGVRGLGVFGRTPLTPEAPPPRSSAACGAPTRARGRIWPRRKTSRCSRRCSTPQALARALACSTWAADPDSRSSWPPSVARRRAAWTSARACRTRSAGSRPAGDSPPRYVQCSAPADRVGTRPAEALRERPCHAAKASTCGQRSLDRTKWARAVPPQPPAPESRSATCICMQSDLEFPTEE